ncbi:MAG: NAD(P)-dependent oxidoreductase [Chloroflexi bacterium]|nr:NAD(P)-dependent oxidoreductase [Chloroflexota bacterium]
MRVLITGAAGNLGSNLARRMLCGPDELRLLIHRKPLPLDIATSPRASVCRADLGNPATLASACLNIDCIVHFAGVLFAPDPEKFLLRTNVKYVENLVDVALAAGVRKFILISFPHVEGESRPGRPAMGRLDGNPSSVHARTRLAAEKYLFKASEGTTMVPVALRPGMIYGRGVLMINAARWLLRHNLLAVWPQPTWIHLLSLPDFLSCVVSAVEGEKISGVYNLGDGQPLTLQTFLDAAAAYWGFRKPWRLPRWSFYFAGWSCETFARIFRTASPLTRDFIKIGMASYVSDTSRMKEELLSELAFPTLNEGLVLL